ncbi:MAG: 2-hydroxyacid dehydrogenase [Solirubrobacteraceae bacterium]
MAHCFVTRQLPGQALDRLRAEHDVDVWPERLPPDPTTLRERTREAAGLLSLLTDSIDAAFMDANPQLKAIANYAVGYDNIDIDAATARGIPVGNTPDVLTNATADLAFALLLAAARMLPEAIASVHAGDWLKWEPARYLGHDVHGATLGIIGFGRIGQAVARRAKGFDMEVLTADTRSDAPDQLGNLLQRSDFVSLHCPLTPLTRHLINAQTLSQMRPNAILINTTRGPIVDQAALAEALHAGTIAGAALDVTDPEPLAPDDPLLSAPNLIVVPHIGSATRTARERMADLAVDNLLAGLAGRPMPHQVNRLPERDA